MAGVLPAGYVDPGLSTSPFLCGFKVAFLSLFFNVMK